MYNKYIYFNCSSLASNIDSILKKTGDESQVPQNYKRYLPLAYHYTILYFSNYSTMLIYIYVIRLSGLEKTREIGYENENVHRV